MLMQPNGRVNEKGWFLEAVEGVRVTCFKPTEVLKEWALSSEQLTCQTW